MEDKVLEKVDEKIKEIIEQDINPSNLDHLYKLSKIKHMTKEDKNMYGNYGYGAYSGRGPSRGAYGEGYGYGAYGEGYGYGARGRDSRYRGEEAIERMAGEYGRYQESVGRYGAGEEADKSFHYMIKSFEDFIKVLNEEAKTPQQKQMLKEALQKSMM